MRKGIFKLFIIQFRYIGDKANSVQALAINFFRICRNGFVYIIMVVDRYRIQSLPKSGRSLKDENHLIRPNLLVTTDISAHGNRCRQGDENARG